MSGTLGGAGGTVCACIIRILCHTQKLLSGLLTHPPQKELIRAPPQRGVKTVACLFRLSTTYSSAMGHTRTCASPNYPAPPAATAALSPSLAASFQGTPGAETFVTLALSTNKAAMSAWERRIKKRGVGGDENDQNEARARPFRGCSPMDVAAPTFAV